MGLISGRILRVTRVVLAALALASGAVFSHLAVAGPLEDFFNYVKIDNAHEVRSMLRRGFNPNVSEPHRGDTPLIVAVAPAL